jgi:hypothetical protein
MNRSLFLLALSAVTLSLVGCSPSKVPVSGKLEWADGQPATELVDGQVIFESAELKTSARGVITKDGTFRITTETANDGVLPGTYKVAVVEHRPAPEGTTKLPPQHLQDKYYSFDTSGLTATIAPGQADLVFKLERMPGKK